MSTHNLCFEQKYEKIFSAPDKVLSNWVFWFVFTCPFLIELGISPDSGFFF